MFCPNCGEKIIFEQIYCRSCGIAIGEMQQKMSEFLTDSVKKVDWLKRIGLFSIGTIFSGIVIFASILFANAFRLAPGVLIFFFMALFALLMGFISVLYFEKNKFKKQKSETIENKDYVKHTIESWKTNRKLNESSFQPIESVTDNTTELFTAAPLRRKTSGELG